MWSGWCALATCYNSSCLFNFLVIVFFSNFRLWDLERDDNHVLPLDEGLGFEKGEMVHCVSYCAAKG